MSAPNPTVPQAPYPAYYVILNRGSGNADADTRREQIAGILGAQGRRCEFLLPSPGERLSTTARRAVELARRHPGAVVAAGGDGTINAVAQAVHGSECPLGVIALGTFNYFARAHGIPQGAEAGAHALLHARCEPVQVGLVNDQLFLVNASLGLYPQLLQDREAYKRQLGRSRTVAMIAGIATLLREFRQLRLKIRTDGTMHALRTPTLIVVNNPLQLQQLGFAEADALQRGQLVGIAIKPIGSGAMLGLALRGLLGRLGEADNILSLPLKQLTVQPLARRRIKLAVDGEILRLACPLVFRVAPQPLLLLKPRPEDRAETQ